MIYSSHVFMFPFRFDYIPEKKEYDREFSFYKDKGIDERLSITKLLEALNREESDWQYEKFDLKEVLKHKQAKYYSEFAYFYDYAREALYNMQEFDLKKDAFQSELSYYFESKRFNDTKMKPKNHFVITTPKTWNKLSKTYTLRIDGISLRIFSTGIGIFSIELENHDYEEIEDIKAINEYGRRFYPQYLGKDPKKDTIDKPPFLAEKIEIISEGHRVADETFKLSSLAVGTDNEIRIGDHIFKLLGECFTQELDKADHFYIQPILDDRMFVLSWYGNDYLSKHLSEDDNYTHDNGWYEYVFVDRHKDTTVQNDWFKYQLLSDATYDRWSGYKTFYGVTRYSFVALTDAEDFGRDVIRIHIHTMYFQMMMLLLATRASILRFSDEVAAVATLADAEEEERLKSLYERYLSFYNRLYFKEVTHQDQGIEIYDIALKQMKIPDHIAKLDGKFVKLFDLATLKSELRHRNALEEEQKQKEIERQEAEEERERAQKHKEKIEQFFSLFALPGIVLTLMQVAPFAVSASVSGWICGFIFVLLSVIAGLLLPKSRRAGIIVFLVTLGLIIANGLYQQHNGQNLCASPNASVQQSKHILHMKGDTK